MKRAVGYALLVVLCLATTALGELTKLQQAQLTTVGRILKKAADFYTKQEYGKAGKEIAKLQNQIVKLHLLGNEDVLSALAPAEKRVRKARQLLADKGIELPEFTLPSAGAGKISFRKQIAPIFLDNCGRCHVRDDKGDFSLETYAKLMKGGPGGKSIVRGKPNEGTLVKLITDGEMPKGKKTLDKVDIDLIRDWVSAGARFDGKVKTTELENLVEDKEDDEDGS